MDSEYGTTTFADFPYANLVAMLAAARPADVGAATDDWRRLTTRLDEAIATLEQQHTRFQDLWQGPAARAHAAMVTALLDGLRDLAFTTGRVSDALAEAREALDAAHDRLTALPSGDAEQAAAILGELRDAYLRIDLPDIPTATDPPVPAVDGSPILAARAPNGRALYPDLWRDGLIAAAGAPPVSLLPGFAAPPVPGPAPAATAPSVPEERPPVRLPTGSAQAEVRAVGHSSLAPRLDAATGLSTVAGAAGVVTGTPGTPMMGGFLPPPMLGGPPGDQGRPDGRGAPPWLVETKSVFGAAFAVVPTVVD